MLQREQLSQARLEAQLKKRDRVPSEELRKHVAEQLNAARAVYRAIYGQEGLDRYAMRSVPTIHIIVKNGHVFLEGAVATEADKNMANLRANGVSGVFSVTNNLHVDRA